MKIISVYRKVVLPNDASRNVTAKREADDILNIYRE